MDITPFEASELHREGKLEEAHDCLRDYFDFVYCPWCGEKLHKEMEEKKDESP